MCEKLQTNGQTNALNSKEEGTGEYKGGFMDQESLNEV